VPAGSELLIVGGQWPPPRLPGTFEPADVRAHVIADLIVRGEPGAGTRGRLEINGLALEGTLIVDAGDLGELRVVHSTIVPGAGELRVDGENDDLRLDVTRAVTGPIFVVAPVAGVSVSDSIVVGTPGGSPSPIAIEAGGNLLAIERSTIHGGTHARVIDASNSIFTAPVLAERRQKGCIRFSFLPAGSRTARRHRCQPETAIATALASAREAAQDAGQTLSAEEEAAIAETARRRVVPAFASLEYGDPDLAQLLPQCPDEIRKGSDTGSSMGAWCFLGEPHREANLAAALDEYLRFGLQAGAFFVPLPRWKERR
jgi:hypothetical protein